MKPWAVFVATLGSVLAGLAILSPPTHTQVSSRAALTGTVTSQAEGRMEGVLVTAKRASSTVTTTVVTDAQGQYSYPQNRLEPGTYTLAVRASGYELPGPTSATVTDRTATLDLTLNEVTDPLKLASHLTTTEWFNSMPGTEEEKDLFVRHAVHCGMCHTMEKVVRARYSEAEWLPVVHRMAAWDADRSSGVVPGRAQLLGGVPRPRDGVDVYANEYDTWWGQPMEKMAQFLATINLSDGKTTWPYELKRLPRPKGRATRVIVTVYPIPRQPSSIHDLDVDSKGNVWYGNSGWDYIGRLDPKTGTWGEWAVPRAQPGGTEGIGDVIIDPQDNLWIGGGTKFDTNEETWVQLPQGQGCGGFWAHATPALDTLWAGPCRVNYKTGETQRFDRFKSGIGGLFTYEGAPPGAHRAYQTERDSKDNGYINDWGARWDTPAGQHYVIRIDGETGEATFTPTPTAKSFPRRGAMDPQDRFWFGEFWADNIGMLDTKTGRIEEFPFGIKYFGAYFARPDKNGEVWVSSVGSDRVARFTPETGEMTHYLMPAYYDSRKVVADPSTENVTLWLPNKNMSELIRIEPLD